MHTNTSKGRLSEIFFTRKILYLSDLADLNVSSVNPDERLVCGVLVFLKFGQFSCELKKKTGSSGATESKF